jgi:hypothetical protein
VVLSPITGSRHPPVAQAATPPSSPSAAAPRLSRIAPPLDCSSRIWSATEPSTIQGMGGSPASLLAVAGRPQSSGCSGAGRRSGLVGVERLGVAQGSGSFSESNSYLQGRIGTAARGGHAYPPRTAASRGPSGSPRDWQLYPSHRLVGDCERCAWEERLGGSGYGDSACPATRVRPRRAPQPRAPRLGGRTPRLGPVTGAPVGSAAASHSAHNRGPVRGQRAGLPIREFRDWPPSLPRIIM